MANEGDMPGSSQGGSGHPAPAAEPDRAAPDPGKLIEMALRVWHYKQGEVVSLMIHLGDRLGL